MYLMRMSQRQLGDQGPEIPEFSLKQQLELHIATEHSAEFSCTSVFVFRLVT